MKTREIETIIVFVCIILKKDMNLKDLKALMEDDLSAVLTILFYQCNSAAHLEDPKVGKFV